MNRRAFLAGAASSALMLNGCFLLVGLLRFGVRGRLIRSAARGSRISPRATLSSFGRVGSAAFQISRLMRLNQAISKLGEFGQIYDLNSGEDAVEIKSNAKVTECFIDRVPIISTRDDGRYLLHYSNALQCSIGYSTIKSETTIVHQDNENKRIGSDILEKNKIIHVDEHGNLIGTTPFTQTKMESETLIKMTDDSYILNELEELINSLNEEDYKFMRNQLEEIYKAQSKCLSLPSDVNCNDLSAKAQIALDKLDKKFR